MKKVVFLTAVLLVSLVSAAQAGLVAYYDFEIYHEAIPNLVVNKANHALHSGNVIGAERVLSEDPDRGYVYKFENGSFITFDVDISKMQNVTMGAWIKPTPGNDNCNVFTNLGRGLAINDGNWAAANGDSYKSFTRSVDEDWQFVAIVFGYNSHLDENYALLWTNYYKEYVSLGDLAEGRNSIFLGRGSDPNGYFNGLVDDFFILDHALSYSELSVMETEGVTVSHQPVPSAGLLLYAGLMCFSAMRRK